MRQLAAARNWTIDSAGTESYHVGSKPDRRAIETARLNGVDISMQRARQIEPGDFLHFDFIYAMSTDVLKELQEQFRSSENVKLFLEHAFPGEMKSVPDPWYGTAKDFELAFRLVEQGCKAILHYHTKYDMGVNRGE
jgi:protein-tyrosine phosphatase